MSGACPGPLHLASALGAWLGAAPRDDADCLTRFGVGRDTLDRIVRCEVRPEAEITARIWAVIAPATPELPPSFAIGRGAAGRRIIMAFAGEVHSFDVEAARELHRNLGELLLFLERGEVRAA